VESGDVISVGAKGAATIKFEDGQIVALGENSKFAIEKYDYNKAKVAESNVVLSLLTGGMRFVTGIIGGTRKDAIAMKAGTATIGIRGTDVILIVDRSGAVIATVQDGQVSFAARGTVANLVSGEGSTTTGVGGRPTAARPVANLPAGVTRQAAVLGTTGLPANNPVVVTASAATARVLSQIRSTAASMAATERAIEANQKRLADPNTPQATKDRLARTVASQQASLTTLTNRIVAASNTAEAAIRTETASNTQARQQAVTAGAPPTAGTTPPTQGSGVGTAPVVVPVAPTTSSGAANVTAQAVAKSPALAAVLSAAMARAMPSQAAEIAGAAATVAPRQAAQVAAAVTSTVIRNEVNEAATDASRAARGLAPIVRTSATATDKSVDIAKAVIAAVPTSTEAVKAAVIGSLEVAQGNTTTSRSLNTTTTRVTAAEEAAVRALTAPPATPTPTPTPTTQPTTQPTFTPTTQPTPSPTPSAPTCGASC
jgi:hypothetical protein